MKENRNLLLPCKKGGKKFLKGKKYKGKKVANIKERQKKKKKKKKKRRIDLGGFQHFPGRLLLRSFSLLIFFAVPLHCGDILKIRMFEYRQYFLGSSILLICDSYFIFISLLFFCCQDGENLLLAKCRRSQDWQAKAKSIHVCVLRCHDQYRSYYCISRLYEEFTCQPSIMEHLTVKWCRCYLRCILCL